MTPETVYLTCKAFGCYRQPLHVAYTGHLVLDLARLKYSPSDSRQRAAGQHSVFAGKSDSDCPACRGLHRKHTCSRGTGTSARPTRSGDPDSELPPSGDSQSEPKQQQTTGAQPVGDREGETPGASSSTTPSSPSPSAVPSQGPPVTGPHSIPPVVVEPQDGNPEGFPIALRRVHEKLKDKSELLKLHLKHYHMTLEQFKKRTSALRLPAAIYDLYEQVVKSCDVCLKTMPPPSRSRVSGIRAINFGDIWFWITVR